MPKVDYQFNIVLKNFTDEKGNDHEYPSYELTVGGSTFILSARSEDKKLLKYILETNGFFD